MWEKIKISLIFIVVIVFILFVSTGGAFTWIFDIWK